MAANQNQKGHFDPPPPRPPASFRVKPAKGALCNSDADVGNWMVAKNCSTNVAPRNSINLFHVSDISV